MFLWSVALAVPQVLSILYASIGMIGLSALLFFPVWSALVFLYTLVPVSFRRLPSRNASGSNQELESLV